MSIWRLSLVFVSVVCSLRSSAVEPADLDRDLDVGIPPGSPITWGSRIPAIMPRDRVLFPKRIGGAPGRRGGSGTHTVAQQAKTEARVRVTNSFGVVRILTWDIAGHLNWVARPTTGGADAPLTGRSVGAKVPTPEDSLYWVCMTPLLRQMLHPQHVSRGELVAHLVEIGEAASSALENAKSEPSLAEMCAEVQSMIAPTRRRTVAFRGKVTHETMLRRFLAEELVREYPYDPNGAFGRRFLLLGEEIVPLLIAHAKSADSLLRRNAVAALGRFGTSGAAIQALNSVAAETRDVVVLTRALSALAALAVMPNPKPLVRRMRATGSPTEEVALVVALGRCGRREAIPYLQRLAGKREHPDLQLAALTALARIRFEPKGKDLWRLAEKISLQARKNPASFAVRPSARPDKRRRPPRADVPDTDVDRGRIIEQMALLLRARLDHEDKAASERLLSFLGKKPARRVPGDPRRRDVAERVRARAQYPNWSMGDVAPAVQLIYIQTLRELGKKGPAALETIATDSGTEPILRGQAILHLPYDDKVKIAKRLVSSSREKPELRIYALEVLLQSGATSLTEVCEKLLEECAKLSPTKTSPEQRYLWRESLRVLQQRRALTTRILDPLLRHVVDRRVVVEDKGEIIARVKAAIDELIGQAVERKARRSRRASIGALVDLVIENKLRPFITKTRRKQTIDYIEKQLEVLRGRRNDANYRRIIRSGLISHLTGEGLSYNIREKVSFKPIVPFEEEILFSVGLLGSKRGAETLVKFLAENPQSPFCAHACLAVGMTGHLPLASKLTASLIHSDGFVRYCAYRGLRQLTGQDFFADWMYGKRTDWVQSAEKYMRWLGRRK